MTFKSKIMVKVYSMILEFCLKEEIHVINLDIIQTTRITKHLKGLATVRVFVLRSSRNKIVIIVFSLIMTTAAAKQCSHLFAVRQATLPIYINNSTKLFPIHRIYCVGRNYRDHAIEMGHKPNNDQKIGGTLLLSKAM
jgi:hypothetical protein